MRPIFLFVSMFAAVVFAHGAGAAPRERLAPSICDGAIDVVERTAKLPPGLLVAIAKIETGRPNPATGRIEPWPWTINAGGVGYVFATEADAVAAVQKMQALGVQSIDVGCMQVNLLQHPQAFANLAAAFDPANNVAIAARFLWSLYRASGSWPQAAAAYHSHTPGIALPYERQVMAAWPFAARYGGVLGVTAAPSFAEVDPFGVATPQLDRRLLEAAAARKARDAAIAGPALAVELLAEPPSFSQVAGAKAAR